MKKISIFIFLSLFVGMVYAAGPKVTEDRKKGFVFPEGNIPNGFSCDKDSDCYTSRCTNGICTLNNPGASCKIKTQDKHLGNDRICTYGYECDGTECIKRIINPVQAPVTTVVTSVVTETPKEIKPYDCKKSQNCILKKVNDCSPAKSYVPYDLKTNIYFEINGIEGDKCRIQIGLNSKTKKKKCTMIISDLKRIVTYGITNKNKSLMKRSCN